MDRGRRFWLSSLAALLFLYAGVTLILGRSRGTNSGEEARRGIPALGWEGGKENGAQGQTVEEEEEAKRKTEKRRDATTQLMKKARWERQTLQENIVIFGNCNCNRIVWRHLLIIVEFVFFCPGMSSSASCTRRRT